MDLIQVLPEEGGVYPTSQFVQVDVGFAGEHLVVYQLALRVVPRFNVL